MGRNHPDDFEFSLIQKADQRAFQLDKMRSKLAGHQLGLKRAPKPKQVFLAAAFTKPIPMDVASSWAWKIMLALSLILGNGAYFLFRHEEKVRLAIKRMPMLHVPKAALDPNRQALYWTYALYDYDRLVSEFGALPSAIVDFGFAKARLAELLPKLDPVTRQTVENYLPGHGGKP